MRKTWLVNSYLLRAFSKKHTTMIRQTKSCSKMEFVFWMPISTMRCAALIHPVWNGAHPKQVSGFNQKLALCHSLWIWNSITREYYKRWRKRSCMSPCSPTSRANSVNLLRVKFTKWGWAWFLRSWLMVIWTLKYRTLTGKFSLQKIQGRTN
jgi:hypothetical protein